MDFTYQNLISCVAASGALLLAAGIATTEAPSALRSQNGIAYLNCLPGERGSAKALANFWADRSLEEFVIQDLCSDHHSAIVQWRLGGSSALHKLWATRGYGTGKSRAVALSEARDVDIRACYGDSDTQVVLGCSDWVDAEA